MPRSRSRLCGRESRTTALHQSQAKQLPVRRVAVRRPMFALRPASTRLAAERPYPTGRRVATRIAMAGASSRELTGAVLPCGGDDGGGRTGRWAFGKANLDGLEGVWAGFSVADEHREFHHELQL